MPDKASMANRQQLLFQQGKGLVTHPVGSLPLMIKSKRTIGFPSARAAEKISHLCLAVMSRHAALRGLFLGAV